MGACFQQRVAANCSSHAWSGDGTLLAVCPSDNTIQIYAYDTHAKSLTRLQTLQQHSQLVASCDWNSARELVTVSHDRTALVWQPSDDAQPAWQPCQVMMRLKRAALCVAWAPTQQRKFAVGSASGTVAVCFPDATQGWFASKPIKRKHNASVVALAWAPGGATLATASTDGHCRVLCAGIKEVDGVAPPAAFGSVLYEVEIGAGWVYGVCWSPSGDLLAAVCRDNLVVMMSGMQRVATDQPTQFELQHDRLPFLCGSFLADDLFVAAGFDGEPWLAVRDDEDGGWVLAMSLLAGDDLTARLQAARITGDAPSAPDTILQLVPLGDASGSPSGMFSTLGRDGVVSLFDVTQCSALTS